MYKRKENIKEENLNWDSVTNSAKGKSIFHESYDAKNKSSLKNKDFILEENLTMVSIFTLFIFPYILGFVLCYFLFFVYGAMNIIDFIMIQGFSLSIGSWAIGIYIILNIAIIWFAIKAFPGFTTE